MGTQWLVYMNVFLMYQEGCSLFLYMMQSLDSLFKRGPECHCYSPHHSQVTSKKKKDSWDSTLAGSRCSWRRWQSSVEEGGGPAQRASIPSTAPPAPNQNGPHCDCFFWWKVLTHHRGYKRVNELQAWMTEAVTWRLLKLAPSGGRLQHRTKPRPERDPNWTQAKKKKSE